MNVTRSHLRLCYFGRQMLFRQRMMALNRPTNSRSIFGFSKKKTQNESKEVVVNPIELEAKNELTEEEIMKMRDVSRLPPLVKSQLIGRDLLGIRFLWQMQTYFIRSYYAKYGRNSGVKPGVMWPSKEELEWQKGYEKAFCKPFHQMVEELNERKHLEEKTIKDREKEVMANLKLLPKYKKEFWQKYHQMKDDLKEEKVKKEKLIQEVREFVGYDLDPKDPRFEEALLRKDEEKKKEVKAQRKAERQKATLERLQALANEAMEREREEQTILDKSKTETKKEDN